MTSRTQVSSSLLWSFSRSWIGSSKIGLSQALGADPLWNTRRGHAVVAFRVVCFFFVFLSAVRIAVASEPELPQVGPEIMQDEFEPPVAGLFLLVYFWVV